MKKEIITGIIISILIIYGGYSLSTGSETESAVFQSSRQVQVSVKVGEESQSKSVKITKNKLKEIREEPEAVKPEIVEEDRQQEQGIEADGNQEQEIKEEAEETVKRFSLIDQIEEYRVKKGDNLWDIARRYGIDVDTIIGANDITNMNRIKPGDIIRILPVKGILYKINPGENLWTISRQFDIDIDEIVKANNIADPDLVKPGRLLILPGAKPEFGYKERLQRKFIKPVNARISSYFGGRWGRMHEGIDYAVNLGTPIKAAGSGKVIYSGWASGYGKTIIIEHRKGLRTLYAHNSELLAHSGEWVEQGEIIAKSGNTGRSTGPHLHFEVQINGKPVNPLSYLR